MRTISWPVPGEKKWLPTRDETQISAELSAAGAQDGTQYTLPEVCADGVVGGLYAIPDRDGDGIPDIDIGSLSGVDNDGDGLTTGLGDDADGDGSSTPRIPTPTTTYILAKRVALPRAVKASPAPAERRPVATTTAPIRPIRIRPILTETALVMRVQIREVVER